MGQGRQEVDQQTRRDQQDTTPSLDNDAVFRALTSTRRRRLLAVLLDGTEWSVGELATILAGCHAADTGEMVVPADRDRIVVELRHVHLPYLDEAGLVTHDCEEGTVRLEQLDDAVAELLRRCVDFEGQGE